MTLGMSVAGQVHAECRHPDLGRLADVHLANVLFIDLRDDLHHVRVTHIEDALVSHALSRPCANAKNPAG